VTLAVQITTRLLQLGLEMLAARICNRGKIQPFSVGLPGNCEALRAVSTDAISFADGAQLNIRRITNWKEFVDEVSEKLEID
jgi:hypothetical protein